MNVDLANAEPFLLGEIQDYVSCESLVTIFLSHD